MSFANSFSVLGDGASGAKLEHQPPVAQSTSSKKGDHENPKADPARARPKKQDPNGNNAAFKNKNAGRSANRKVEAPTTTNNHRSARHERTDRQNKSGKTDTAKRVKAGWGDDNKVPEDEEAGEEIAHADEAADQAEDEALETPKQQTLEEYLAEQKADGLNVNRGPRKANEGDNALANSKLLVKEEQEQEVAPRKQPTKQKTQKKQVVTLDPVPSAMPPLIQRGDDRRGGRGGARGDSRSGPRGGRGGGRGGARGGGRGGRSGRSDSRPSSKPKSDAPKVNLAALPRLPGQTA